MPTVVTTLTITSKPETEQTIKDLIQKPAGNPSVEAVALRNYFEAVSAGQRQCQIDLQVNGGDSVAADGDFEFTGPGAVSDTVLINGVTFTAVASGAGNNEFNIGVPASLAVQDLTYTAKAAGEDGNDIAIAYVAPASGTHALSVGVVSEAITVNLRSTAAVAATGALDYTADVALTSVATGTARNTTTFRTVVNVAAANPAATILVGFTGTAAAIICTVTPNDGTNNGAVPVDLTTAQLRELITTGAVVGKTVTITDASSFRILQTATGGGATNLANGGEGDGVTATFASGANFSVALSTADDILAAIEASGPADALVAVEVTGTGSTVQVAASAANLAGGTGAAADTAASLAEAINDSSTGAVNLFVSATSDAGVTTVTAKAKGISGNTITTAVGVDSLSEIDASGARLTGGTEATAWTYHCGF